MILSHTHMEISNGWYPHHPGAVGSSQGRSRLCDWNESRHVASARAPSRSSRLVEPPGASSKIGRILGWKPRRFLVGMVSNYYGFWFYRSTNPCWLVVEPPLWKILVNWDDDIPNIWKNEKCSKPPTRFHRAGKKNIGKPLGNVLQAITFKWNCGIANKVRAHSQLLFRDTPHARLG